MLVIVKGLAFAVIVATVKQCCFPSLAVAGYCPLCSQTRCRSVAGGLAERLAPGQTGCRSRSLSIVRIATWCVGGVDGAELFNRRRCGSGEIAEQAFGVRRAAPTAQARQRQKSAFG